MLKTSVRPNWSAKNQFTAAELFPPQAYTFVLDGYRLPTGTRIPHHSTAHIASHTVTESIKYFTKRGSRVYCAFLDATKAFDKVLHNGIYKKLLERGASVNFIYLLQNWYGRLQCRVRWNDMLGELFPVTCGVRQGGILSPYLFAIYIDDLITHLKNSGYGIYVGQIFTRCALYADDIALYLHHVTGYRI